MNDEIIECQGDGPDTTQKTKWVDWDLEVRRSIMLYTIQSQWNAVQSLMQAQIRRCLWTRGDREIKIARQGDQDRDRSQNKRGAVIEDVEGVPNSSVRQMGEKVDVWPTDSSELRSCRNGRQGDHRPSHPKLVTEMFTSKSFNQRQDRTNIVERRQQDDERNRSRSRVWFRCSSMSNSATMIRMKWRTWQTTNTWKMMMTTENYHTWSKALSCTWCVASWGDQTAYTDR